MVVTSKYSKFDAEGNETLLTVTIPDDEYGDMLVKYSTPELARYDILNDGAYIMQKRADIQTYLNQKLNDEQISEIKIYAEALARQYKLIAACTDDACGYRDIQMRLAGGHRLSAGMQREIKKIQATLDALTQNEIDDCIDHAMDMLGYCSKSQFDYDKSRCGRDTWIVERVLVTGMDRETVLKKLGKK